MRRNETPYPMWMNFCMTVDIHDVITLVNFGDDQLRGLGVAGGQILAFPIDFDRRPYNTLALPCECVIYTNCELHLSESLNRAFARWRRCITHCH